jgi:hypothetical protein
MTPPDLWGTFRASQYVVWGGEGQIYNNQAAFQTFPGIAIILAPIAKISSIFRLSASFPVNLPRPSAWLLLGPTNFILGALLLFPLDRLARRLLITARRRIFFLIVESALIWPSVALWGHPEDALSLALGIYGMLAAFDSAWFRVGAFFGLAIAVQPLILLIVPIALAFVPIRRWPLVTIEAVVPSLVLLLSPLIQEWGPTTQRLLRQPNFVLYNHPTPWISLAPVLTPSHFTTIHSVRYVTLSDGHRQVVEVTKRVFLPAVVSAGPGRIIAVLIACLVGVLAKLLKPSLTQVVWLTALVLSLRCLFEPVMVPYYLLPGLALAVVIVSTSSHSRFTLAVVSASVCTFLSYQHLSPWVYYFAMAFPLLVVLAVSVPPSWRRPKESVEQMFG